MKKILFILSFLFIHFCYSQNSKDVTHFVFHFDYEYNQNIKNNIFCFSNYKYTGVGDIYRLNFSNSSLIKLLFGIRLKNTAHFFGFKSLTSKFSSELEGELYQQFSPYPSNSESFKINISSNNKYHGINYAFQFFFPFKKIDGLYTEINLYYCYNENARYFKSYMQYYEQQIVNSEKFKETTEILPYNRFAYGIDLSLGYNQNIWNGIQLSAYSGISYRFISIYYHFGLGLNYKFSLPKKKKE